MQVYFRKEKKRKTKQKQKKRSKIATKRKKRKSRNQIILIIFFHQIHLTHFTLNGHGLVFSLVEKSSFLEDLRHNLHFGYKSLSILCSLDGPSGQTEEEKKTPTLTLTLGSLPLGSFFFFFVSPNTLTHNLKQQKEAAIG